MQMLFKIVLDGLQHVTQNNFPLPIQTNYPHVKMKLFLAELNSKRNHSHKAAWCYIRSMQMRLDHKIIQCSTAKAGFVLLLCVLIVCT